MDIKYYAFKYKFYGKTIFEKFDCIFYGRFLKSLQSTKTPSQKNVTKLFVVMSCHKNVLDPLNVHSQNIKSKLFQ